MSATLKALGIDRMSIDERLLLAEEIWDSIAAEQEHLAIPLAHQEELDRRLAARAAHPQAGSSWETVKARLQGKP